MATHVSDQHDRPIRVISRGAPVPVTEGVTRPHPDQRTWYGQGMWKLVGVAVCEEICMSLRTPNWARTYVKDERTYYYTHSLCQPRSGFDPGPAGQQLSTLPLDDRGYFIVSWSCRQEECQKTEGQSPSTMPLANLPSKLSTAQLVAQYSQEIQFTCEADIKITRPQLGQLTLDSPN